MNLLFEFIDYTYHLYWYVYFYKYLPSEKYWKFHQSHFLIIDNHRYITYVEYSRTFIVTLKTIQYTYLIIYYLLSTDIFFNI